MHPAFEGIGALPYFDEFDLSTVDVLLISQYVIILLLYLPPSLQERDFRDVVCETSCGLLEYVWRLALSKENSGSIPRVERRAASTAQNRGIVRVFVQLMYCFNIMYGREPISSRLPLLLSTYYIRCDIRSNPCHCCSLVPRYPSTYVYIFFRIRQARAVLETVMANCINEQFSHRSCCFFALRPSKNELSGKGVHDAPDKGYLQVADPR